MGIVYEAMRKIEESEKEFFDEDESKEYVSFYEFIIILTLYGDDSEKMVAEYLIRHDDFLKLDYYIYDSFFSKAANSEIYNSFHSNAEEIEIVYNEDDSFSLPGNPEILQMMNQYGFHKQKYDSSNCEENYPTESFLEQILENHVEDFFNNSFWKTEDLLALDCISSIGLDANAFEECYKALNSDPSTVLRYIRERKELNEKLTAEQVKASRSQNIDPDVYDMTLKQLAKKDNEIKDLKSKLEILEQKAVSNNDKPMHPRTSNNASKIIAALTSELLNMDLTQPFANDSNGKIMAAIEKQGNTVSKDVIAHWLKLAHENSI